MVEREGRSTAHECREGETVAVVGEEPSGDGWVRAASLARLVGEGQAVFTGGERPVVLFDRDGEVFALDNRCPHMGFPLSRGTVEDGMVVCHWHHARFDLRSGCTFDLWADDAPAYETRIHGGDVYIRPVARPEPEAYWRRRLREGMAQDVTLVMVKAVHALLTLGVHPRALAAEAGLFGAENRDAFGSGLVVLTAMANVAEMVPPTVAALALAQGVARAAGDASGATPHRPRQPLEREQLPPATARRWMRRWAAARHRDGAERTLLTMAAGGADPAVLADAVFADRVYADGGHTLDFANKAFELAELVGWAEGARRVLPALIPNVAASRGADESASWRSPVDLIGLADQAAAALPAALRQGRGSRWTGRVADVADRVLAEHAPNIVQALLDAVARGCPPVQLAHAVAHAAAQRIARFGPSNEFGDWDTALHTLAYAQAVRHTVARCGADVSPDVLRAVVHGALSVYQDRFLNVPPARLPDAAATAGLPDSSEALCAALLHAMDGQGHTEAAARIAARHHDLGLPPEPLLAALAESVVREDAAFHTFQALEAGLRLWRQWDGAPEGRTALIAVARYAAAHAPTQRSFLQTVGIAERLQRGEALHEEV
jgi:nitrite reductase/ring-hydroxylating ferredoxin subunit